MKLKMLTNGADVFDRSVVKGLFPESFVSAREYEEFGSGEAPRYEDVQILLMNAASKQTCGTWMLHWLFHSTNYYHYHVLKHQELDFGITFVSTYAPGMCWRDGGTPRI